MLDTFINQSPIAKDLAEYFKIPVIVKGDIKIRNKKDEAKRKLSRSKRKRKKKHARNMNR